MRASFLLAAYILWLPSLVHSACDSTATTTISDSKGATALASCKSISGSVAIATTVSDKLALDGLEQIKGNLVAGDSSTLTSLSSKSLRIIGQTFQLGNLTMLQSISFPALESASKLRWKSLPNLGSVEFDRGIRSEKVNIQDTFIQALNISAADEIYIGHNSYTKNISIGLANVTGSLTVEFNGRDTLLDLPELYWANNITAQNIATINMPLLNTVNDTLNISSTSLKELNLPNLGSVKRNLAILQNDELSRIQLPGLLQLQELEILNNTKLANLTFDNLGVISGDVLISGNLSSVEIPVLQSANGTFSIEPANSTFNCDAFDTYKKNNVIKNDYQCNGTHSDPSATAFNSDIPSATPPPSGNTNPTTTPPSSSALPTGSKVGIGIGAVAGMAALAGGAVLLYLRRRKQWQRSVDEAERAEKAERDSGSFAELHHEESHVELPNGDEAQELPAGHGVSEVSEGRKVQGRKIREIPGTHELPP